MFGLIEEPYGSATSTNVPIDWVALGELQRLRSIESDSFSLNCLEDACDRLLKNTRRSASGTRLAKNLYRDSRKNSRLLRTKHIPLSDSHEIQAPAFDPAEQLQSFEDEQELSRTVTMAFEALPTRTQLAISFKINEVPSVQAAARLGIKERQFRNLIREGLNFLRNACGSPGGLN